MKIRKSLSSVAGPFVYFPPPPKRLQHLHLLELVSGHGHNITVNNDKVGQFPWFDRSFAVLLKSRVGSVARIEGERLFERNALLGCRNLIALQSPASHCGPDSPRVSVIPTNMTTASQLRAIIRLLCTCQLSVSRLFRCTCPTKILDKRY